MFFNYCFGAKQPFLKERANYKSYKLYIKGVHLKKNKKQKTFADNLLIPMSSKMSMSFFLQSKIKVFDENIPGFFSI